MLLDIRGADFLRVQKTGKTRSSDILDPDVVFSGAYDDGNGLYGTVAVSADGIANGKSYSALFGKTFARPPIVFALLRLTQACVQSGNTLFNSGECIPACYYRYQQYNQLPATDYRFNWATQTTGISFGVAGFVGVISWLAFDVDT